MLACYGHMAIAFKARVMPEAEGCNANQSAADVDTHSLHYPYFDSHLHKPAAETVYSSAQWAKDADEAYLTIPTDRNAKRQPSIPSGLRPPMFVAYRAPAHQD